MYGNVAEWTADVYRPIIDEEERFQLLQRKYATANCKNADGTYKK